MGLAEHRHQCTLCRQWFACTGLQWFNYDGEPVAVCRDYHVDGHTECLDCLRSIDAEQAAPDHPGVPDDAQADQVTTPWQVMNLQLAAGGIAFVAGVCIATDSLLADSLGGGLLLGLIGLALAGLGGWLIFGGGE